MRNIQWVGVVVALASSEAAADHYSDRLASEASSIKETPPRAGVEQAPAASGTRPGWCGPLTEAPYTGGLASQLGSYYEKSDLDYLAAAAQALCKNDTNRPVIKKATREIVQLWMNAHGLSAGDAVESIKLSATDKGREDGRRQTCSALEIDGDLGGADRAFVAAKRELFGCGNGSGDMLTQGGSMAALVPWLDSSARPFDDVVRLAYVSHETGAIARALKRKDEYSGGEQAATEMLMQYAIGQFDYKAMDPKAAVQAVDNDPLLKGNAYARIVVKEKAGQARLALLAIEEAVKQKTAKDANLKELLITAPQKGYASYVEAAAKYKAELQRSAEVEQTIFGPSRKAMVGCLKTLKPDLVAVLKTMKRETVNELVDSMNANPVAGLLFRRFGLCTVADGDGGAQLAMDDIEHPVRIVRGPRMAAYWATHEALTKIRADRPKFAINEVPDGHVHRDDVMRDRAHKLRENTVDRYTEEDSGVIKSVKKDKDGVTIVFAKDKQKRWVESCTQTNRLVMWDHQGKPIYDRDCTGKLVMMDVSPDPITMPEAHADGVAPKRMMRFRIAIMSGKSRRAMPFEVYKDKTGKGIVAWMTLGL